MEKINEEFEKWKLQQEILSQIIKSNAKTEKEKNDIKEKITQEFTERKI